MHNISQGQAPEQVNSLEYSVREKTTDLFCDKAESFGMEARCWNWYPRVQKSSKL